MKLEQGMAAIVTGGASGLGRASAAALAKAGLKVAIFDINAEAGEEHAEAPHGPETHGPQAEHGNEAGGPDRVVAPPAGDDGHRQGRQGQELDGQHQTPDPTQVGQRLIGGDVPDSAQPDDHGPDGERPE